MDYTVYGILQARIIEYCDPMDYTVYGILQARIIEYWRGLPFPSPGDRPNPGFKPRSPAFQAGSLPAELPGKPKNTGVGSLSLLQQTFPTQESNQGLLHCRQTLYQLSYQGNPQKPCQNLYYLTECWSRLEILESSYFEWNLVYNIWDLRKVV